MQVAALYSALVDVNKRLDKVFTVLDELSKNNSHLIDKTFSAKQYIYEHMFEVFYNFNLLKTNKLLLKTLIDLNLYPLLNEDARNDFFNSIRSAPDNGNALATLSNFASNLKQRFSTIRQLIQSLEKTVPALSLIEIETLYIDNDYVIKFYAKNIYNLEDLLGFAKDLDRILNLIQTSIRHDKKDFDILDIKNGSLDISIAVNIDVNLAFYMMLFLSFYYRRKLNDIEKSVRNLSILNDGEISNYIEIIENKKKDELKTKLINLTREKLSSCLGRTPSEEENTNFFIAATHLYDMKEKYKIDIEIVSNPNPLESEEKILIINNSIAELEYEKDLINEYEKQQKLLASEDD